MIEEQPARIVPAEQVGGEIGRLRAEVDRLERKVELLDRLAHEDVLVALPNRRGFMRNLIQLIDRVRRYGDSAALLFVDIDGLKMINDSFGHPVGDRALQQVAERLVQGVRASDSVARIGGDEFGVLLERADEAVARDTANRLAGQVAERGFAHKDMGMPLSVAIGVAVIRPGDRPEDVIARADAEMYEAKTAA